jgi:alkanesulfonate monooxygenase SsuD/methylene tetrahydromethanopterin reductase-like flavin-dependent oxidoreductase (luciferase family)
MLRIAGERADGTILWMADERAIAEHVVPRISKAAASAGRPSPRVVAGVPVGLCAADQVDAARERANRILGHADYSPNYQRLLERGDATDVGDIAALGSEVDVERRLRSFADAGATDLSVRVLPVGQGRDELVASGARTREFLAGLAPELR